MWKLSFTLLVFLNLIIGGMLFWQWNAFTHYNEETINKEIETAVQKISVESKGEVLEVTQNVNGLSTGKEYGLEVPELVTEWNCLKEDDTICDSVDENPFSFAAENSSIRIQFSLPLKNDEAFLLNDWIIGIPGVNISNTTIEIIDSTKREGTWVAGFPFKGHSKQELIDYYVFEGEGSVGSLYWQAAPLQSIKGEKSLQYFIKDQTPPLDLSLKDLKEIPNFKGSSVIFTEEYMETNGIGLMVAKPNIEPEVLEKRIIYNHFLGLASGLPIEERWLIDVLISLITGLDGNVPKGNIILGELRNNLSEEEINQFMSRVFEQQQITPQRLDEILGTLKEKKTHFFTLNKNEETKLVPLYFYDNRKIIIQDKLYKDIEILLINNEQLLPFVETMSALGFDVKLLSDEETLLLNKGQNSYRFYVNQNIFIYNQEDYGLLENPLKTIDGKIYMDVDWLKSLLKVTVVETNEEITLTLSF